MYMEMTINRLILREYTAKDAESLHHFFAKDYVTQYAPHLFHQDIADTEAYLQFHINHAQASCRTHFYYAIEQRETGEFIGIIGFSQVEEGAAELEYYLLKAHWDKGLMPEALNALIAFAFEKTSVQKLFAICQTDNENSAKVLEKCAMRKAAKQPESKIYHGIQKTRVCYEIFAK
ncbi:MAG: GNAT family N-acetyltransferase [Defluviitaleaceae bacterium]|nr:GNAT family N-acetyltransferase [Defluviitaleaceae bacterium]